MPRNAAGVPIRPDEYNRNDGFSPGSPIHTFVPGLDFERTGLVPITDMARAFDADQPAVVIDADSGERQLIWAELDANAKSDADRNLYIRPGRNWEEGHRYIVALRNLRDADGHADRGAARVRAPTATRTPARASPPTRAASTWTSCSRRSTRPASSARTSTWRGTSRSAPSSASPSGCSASATTPSPRSATRTSPTRSRPGSAPTFRVTSVQDTPSDPQHRPHGPRHLHRALLPRQAGLPAGLEVPLHGPRLQHADAHPGQHGGADVHLHRPALGGRRPAARLALRPRPVRQPERGRRRQRAHDGRHARLRVLRDRLVGDGPAGRARPRSG